MNRERAPISDAGFSEKQMDLALDKSANNDQVKAGNVSIDPKKKIKPPFQQPR